MLRGFFDFSVLGGLEQRCQRRTYTCTLRRRRVLGEKAPFSPLPCLEVPSVPLVARISF
jgi:hypothetical protein